MTAHHVVQNPSQPWKFLIEYFVVAWHIVFCIYIVTSLISFLGTTNSTRYSILSHLYDYCAYLIIATHFVYIYISFLFIICQITNSLLIIDDLIFWKPFLYFLMHSFTIGWRRSNSSFENILYALLSKEMPL